MVDLSRWNLVTPEATSGSSARTYWPGEFPGNEYFAIMDTGEVGLWAPTKGATTESSDRTRTEFREIIPGTRELKNWKLGEHQSQYLRASMTIKQVTPNGRVCIGQIHIKDISRPVLKIVWDNGSLRAKVRQHCNQSDDPGFTFLDDVPLLERFSYSVAVNGSGLVSVNLTHGSRRGECRFNLLPSYIGRSLYFKAGLYNQDDATESTLATDGSRAVLHSLEVERP